MTAHAFSAPLLPPPLATPVLAEAEHTELGQQLENYLTPLVDYCEQQPQDEALDLAAFRHGQQIRQALDALLRYDEATGKLLAYYRTALAYAQQQASTCVPSLEQVLGLSVPVTPSPRASQSGPPAGEVSHRVDIAAVQRFLASPAMQARAALPPAQRYALARISSYDLPPYAQSRETPPQAN